MKEIIGAIMVTIMTVLVIGIAGSKITASIIEDEYKELDQAIEALEKKLEDSHEQEKEEVVLVTIGTDDESWISEEYLEEIGFNSQVNEWLED